MSRTVDSNTGEEVRRSVRKEAKGWGANVWSGSGYVTNVQRYYYASRSHARKADISHQVGTHGRIA